MDDEGGAGRFTPQNKTTHERLSTNTVGLVALSDFRKRRAEVLEQQEREAREAALSGTSTPDRSNTATPDHAGSDSAHGRASGSRPAKKPKKKGGRKLLSFDDGGGCDDDNDNVDQDGAKGALVATVPSGQQDESGLGGSKFKANAAVGVVPRSLTKAALRKEATEREALRREFMVMQEAVKAAEIAIPFTFYDGANIRGGTVRVKKGDYIWVFLDRSRKVGARQGVGEKAHTLRAWARKGVDDLMLVRGTVIIPHHYDFYYFIVSKTLGPGGTRLFDYSAEPPSRPPPSGPIESGTDPKTAAAQATASGTAILKTDADLSSLEGAKDDPILTKVVDRRWYQRNKHIYPASMWHEFDPEKDYSSEIRRDTGGNTLFLK